MASQYTSKYVGVFRHNGKWGVMCAGRRVGTFRHEEDAARAYDQAAKKTWGANAGLNFPGRDELRAVKGKRWNKTSVQDLIGTKYGKLTIVSEASAKNYRTQVNCICECGNGTIVTLRNLTSGHTRSCGCFLGESVSARLTTHGFTTRNGHHPLYRIWSGIRSRCLNANNNNYKYYGGRGIKMYEEWQNDPGAFFKYIETELGQRPSIQYHTLERIDVNGHYEPGNLRWATMKEQHANKQDNWRKRVLDILLHEYPEIYLEVIDKANRSIKNGQIDSVKI